MLIPRDDRTESMMKYLTPTHSPSNRNLMDMKNRLRARSVGSASPNFSSKVSENGYVHSLQMANRLSARIADSASPTFTSKASENKYVHSHGMSKAAEQRQVDILDKTTPACHHDHDIGASLLIVNGGPSRKPQSQEVLVNPPHNEGETLYLKDRPLAKTSLEELFQTEVQVSQVSEDNSIYVSTYRKSKGIVCEPKKSNGTAPNRPLDMLSDQKLEKYLQEHVFHKNAWCSSCKELPSAHIKCYMHKKGDISQTVEYVRSTDKQDRNIRTWTACCKCKHVNEEVMYETDLESPFGIFLERNLSISATDNSVASCGHSRQDYDCCFGLDGMVAVFHFSPKVNLTVCLHQPEHKSRAQSMSLGTAVEEKTSEVQTTGDSIIPLRDDKMSSVISRALTFKKDEDDNQYNVGCGTIKSSPYQEVSFKTENKKFTVIKSFPADFEALREKLGITNLDFSCSLSASSEFLTEGGKSGACFEESQDRKYLTKDIKKHEVKFFDEHGPVYFECIGDLTMIVKILGIYQVHIEDSNGGSSRCMDLVVMYKLCAGSGENAMSIFDLKGNVRNRFNAPNAKVLLDQNFLIAQHTNPIRLTSDALSKFGADLRKSVAFLQRIGAIDYSLILMEDLVTKEKVVGIIDYLGEYTPRKRCETWIKKVCDLFRGESGTWPTVVHPTHYGDRFIENILAYFPMLPHSSNAELDNLSDATP